MANYPAPRRSKSVACPDQALNAQVADAQRPGLMAAAAIHSGTFAGLVGIQGGAMLSRAADSAFRISPLGEEVYRAIVAAYGTLAVIEIQALSLQNRGH